MSHFKWITKLLVAAAILSTGYLAANCCYTCAPYKDCGFYFGAEGLYWTVCQDGLDYAVDYDDDDDDIILGGGKTEFLNYDWRGGVHGYFGLKACGWNVWGGYTWYKNDWDAHTDSIVKATLLHPATEESVADFAEIESEIKYQMAELLFGKEFTCNKCSIFLPFFGAQVIKLEQEIEVNYDGEDFDDPARVLWESDLEAAGMKAGVDMYFRWFECVGLYGKFAGSILTSRTDINHKQQSLDDGDNTTLIRLEEKEWVCIPGYQIGGGISFNSRCGKCFYFVLEMGYEFNHWFNTPQIRRYHYGGEEGGSGISSDSSGNIAFHGATLSANFYF